MFVSSRRCALLLPLLALLILLPRAEALAGEPGSAGFLSLRLGLGSRAGGMGDTGVADSRGADAVYWNPANLVYSEGTHVTIQHLEYLELFRKESMAVSHTTPYGSIGLLFSGFYSDALTRTTIDRIGVPQGEFRPYDLVVGAAYGYKFRDLSVGITGKFLYQRIDTYGASGFAVDLGVTHRSQIPGLTFAAALQNFGDKMTFREEPFDLPVTFRLGGSYTPQLASEHWMEMFTLATEVVAPNDGNGRLHAGLESRLHELFSLRVGHRFNYETYGLTAGAGFRRGGLSVDYAFMHNDNDFGHTHRFSVSLAFLP